MRRARKRAARGAPTRILAAALLAAVVAGPAWAAEPPPPIKPRPYPLECGSAAAIYGPQRLWWGRFGGSRTTLWDRTVVTFQSVCFLREVDCRNWLYWMNSDWPEYLYYSTCSKGFRP
ncbi:hypothetical protein [Segnochrobactrum spirostomi]|uniref:Uncharacterized protein n=1 Tax=Segnochrobactrum spirostomi TaxID=2608987 RepID=A0A6A7Y0W1_9HYPH|nr:hypothetical protein [Segnochrobactrum spirostomi]MQT12256.1 hypothetical protein [Segnochrobactrum spirostomi]